MRNDSSRQRPQSDAPRSRIGRRELLVGGAVAGAAAVGGLLLARDFGAAPHAYALAPESVLPPDIQRAPADVRGAYRFAVANRDTLRYIPCFCGCDADGHTSNASCYVKDSSTPEEQSSHGATGPREARVGRVRTRGACA